MSNRVSRRQGARWVAEAHPAYDAPAPVAAPQLPAAAAPAGATTDDRITALRDLGALRSQGA